MEGLAPRSNGKLASAVSRPRVARMRYPNFLPREVAMVKPVLILLGVQALGIALAIYIVARILRRYLRQRRERTQ